ncbi:MAG: topoisomerase C-terminal repeat-containing protein, partial [Pseudomonadota bacterium]
NRLIQDFPDEGIQVLNGRYGPYITDKKKNAKIPKDTDPKSLTLEQCIQMLAEAPERGARGRKKAAAQKKTATKTTAAKKKTAKKKATKKKAAAKKKTTRKKTAAKKTAAKKTAAAKPRAAAKKKVGTRKKTAK